MIVWTSSQDQWTLFSHLQSSYWLRSRIVAMIADIVVISMSRTAGMEDLD
jgi:hypothetical protein